MPSPNDIPFYAPDSAAVFASALSLWQACHKRSGMAAKINFSESYSGTDQFMREIMRVAAQFEDWACAHINFEHLDEVWPYALQDKFGDACLETTEPTDLKSFDETCCFRIALKLRFPIIFDGKLPIPVDVASSNPASRSFFKKFRIRTVRRSIEAEYIVPFTFSDDPFDPDFDVPYFGLYGTSLDGIDEHIADRLSYAEAVKLAKNLVPDIQFPESP